jgi:hypothetical protein
MAPPHPRRRHDVVSPPGSGEEQLLLANFHVTTFLSFVIAGLVPAIQWGRSPTSTALLDARNTSGHDD